MKTFLPTLAALLCLAGCANPDGPVVTYANSDAEMSANSQAKFVCSCIFVMERDEAYCKAWSKVTPDIGKFTVDYRAKRVSAATFMAWSASAHFIDERRGCVLE